MKKIKTSVFCIILSSVSLLLSISLYADNAWNQWTSTLWKEKRLGGDTAYSNSLAAKSQPSCLKVEENVFTFDTWQQACNKLPRFYKHKSNTYATFLTVSLFEKEVDQFLTTMKKQLQGLFWLNSMRLSDSCVEFQTYAEKLIIPITATVAIHGDMHGDIHAINRFIALCADKGFMDTDDSFKIKNENFYILFLGDYVDRGWYGAEVLYTIMKLKNKNRDRVFMVRGNHEDISLNDHYGFSKEITRKFSCNAELLSKIHELYNLLPAVLYLGAGSADTTYNFVQCCHGGIEIGFDPHALLEDTHKCAAVIIDNLKQQTISEKIQSYDLDAFKKYFHDMPISSSNGFMWSDFIVDPDKPFALSWRDGHAGSMFDYGQSVTRALLKAWSSNLYTVQSIFRAHQQGDPVMKERILNTDSLSHSDDTGIGKLWIENSIHQNIPGRLDNVAAITFSVAPDTGYGYPIHSFALLKVANEYKDWRLQVLRAPYMP